MTLTRRNRTRRVTILCSHCLRNIAHYRAGWRFRQFRVGPSDFWVSANGALIDVAVLDWCKLFAKPYGKHHWSRVILDVGAFTAGLYARLAVDEARFLEYEESVKHYGDKFVAHLDEELTMTPPFMKLARNSVVYLYDQLRNDAATRIFIPEAYIPGAKLYATKFRDASREYWVAERA
jgi:hypothetical protein